LSGSYQRIRFDANNLHEAQSKAENILWGTVSEAPNLTLAEAFARVIPTRSVKPETRNHYRQFAGYFCEWIEQNRAITYWHQLRFEHVHDYMNSLIDRGCTGKTISHYLEPIRFTALWISKSWPERFSNFCEGFRIPKDIGRSYLFADQQPVGYLTIAELCGFLEWIRINHPSASVIRPGVALQGLCGLQLQEALRLAVSHADFEAGTITIEREVKNRWRVRRLPLPELALDILRDAVESATEKDDRIVRHGGSHWKAYSSLVEGALDKWSGGKSPIPPKDLRNTLPTEAINGGWAGYFVNRYLGHSPQSMAERHYHGEVSRNGRNLIELLQEHVVRHVDLLVNRCTKLHDPAKVISFNSLG
jgi:integrase